VGDEADVRIVHLEAFPTGAEAELVDRVRASSRYRRAFSVVAERGDRVVGHALMSYADLVHADVQRPVLVLAPLAVRPDARRAGVGTALVHECLGRAEHSGEPLVLLTGHASYYPRFGFEAAAAHGIVPPDRVPDEVLLVRRLSAYDPGWAGRLVVPRAFDVVRNDLAHPPRPTPAPDAAR